MTSRTALPPVTTGLPRTAATPNRLASANPVSAPTTTLNRTATATSAVIVDLSAQTDLLATFDLSAWMDPSAPADPAAEESVRRAKTALDMMKQASDAQRKDTKAMAKLRLEWIKEQIRILRQFGGDPKAIAREVARLARDLGAAVKDYVGAARDEPASSSTDPSAGSSAVAGVTAITVSTEVTVTATLQDGSIAGQLAQLSGDLAAEVKEYAEDVPDASSSEDRPAEAGVTVTALEAQVTVTTTVVTVSEDTVTADDGPLPDGLSAEDEEFFALAKGLMQTLRKILNKLKLYTKPGDRDMQEAEKAFHSARTAVNDGLAALAPGINATAVNLQV